MEKLPYVDEPLLDWLEQIYPDKCPEPNMSDREIWMARGAVTVIRNLRRLHEEQREAMLGG